MRALIVEDHPLFREALLHLLASVVGKDAVCTAGSAEVGLRLADMLPNLELILLDLGLPGLNGADAVAAFRRKRPDVPILVISASDDRQDAGAAFRAGARVFMSKAVSSEVVVEVLQRLLSGAMSGQEWITTGHKRDWGDTLLPTLTPRQQETLTLLAQGHSNKEIGLRLGLAEITVKMHVSTVFRVLGVTNRTQAALAARRLGLAGDLSV